MAFNYSAVLEAQKYAGLWMVSVLESKVPMKGQNLRKMEGWVEAAVAHEGLRRWDMLRR